MLHETEGPKRARRGRLSMVLLILPVVAASFLGGVWYQGRKASDHAAAQTRAPLYYACPMHPGYKSDRPGEAPCCGMRLEPVYAGETHGQGAAGTLYLDPARRRLAGVHVEPVTRRSARHVLRTTGRVAPDENRVYRINASTEMWIRKIYPPTTGARVAKDEPLCGFYTTNFLTAAQSYIYILNAGDALAAAGQNSAPQKASNDLQLRQAAELLQNLGVSEPQIAEMAKTRKASALVDVRSPVSGYILSRKITLGQWLGPGTEMYEIADLSGVWIYADLFENEARAFHRGGAARVWSPTLKMAFTAAVSDVPPAFDPATRQSRVRLDVDNPQRALWPGMFVDVELPVEVPAGIAVPADAVVYSGKRKTVYVEREDGGFEARAVETGWNMGDLVQVTQGLREGEKIAVSANFLLDSESRLQRIAESTAAAPYEAAAGATQTAKDLVCGMDVDTSQPGVLSSEYQGVKYYFCSKHCKASFDKDPARYMPKKEKGKEKEKDKDKPAHSARLSPPGERG
ncbi:MAG: efflux RND transporter periplasmic adaptor subunit [Bryobacteraceae bacterium]